MTAPIPIIVLNWNGLADTRECIASLERQTEQHFVIHLVDNGSEDTEAAQIRQLYGTHAKIRLHLNAENLGFTRANNKVCRQLLGADAVAPFVVLLNNDTAVEPDWLANLIAAAQASGADMAAGKMVNYYQRDRMDNAGHHWLNTLEILPLGNDEPVENFTRIQENIGPCAGAALYSSAMLRQIGLFDEHFDNGYEDVELGLRGIICGYRSVFAPDAIVYHKISRSINKIRDFNYTLRIQQHIYYIMAKLIPGKVLLICFPFLLFRTGAALLLNVLFWRWKFLRIQLKAIWWVFTSGRKILLQSRRQFFRAHTPIPAAALLKKMDFFLKKDIRRFYKYLIRREKMVFEKY